MQYNFCTDDPKRGKAALILYAAYRSRNKNSSLNGIETWNRFRDYIRGACLKATNTAEFIDKFCKLGNVGSIKPRYLQDGSDRDLVMLSDGSLVSSGSVKNYHTDIFEDDSLFDVFENEGILLTMLVRDRIQREKMEGITDETDENED